MSSTTDAAGPGQTNGSEMRKAYLELLNWKILHYSKIEKRMRLTYMCTRLLSVIGSILIPVITNTSIEATIWTKKIDFSKLSVTTLGLVVAFALGFEGVFRYRERCLQFSKAKRLLRTQLNFFRCGADNYARVSPDEAFQILVVHVESIINDLQESSMMVLTKDDSEISPGNRQQSSGEKR